MSINRSFHVRGPFRRLLDEQKERLRAEYGRVFEDGDFSEAALVEFFKLPPEVQMDRIYSRLGDLHAGVVEGSILTQVDVGVVHAPKVAGGRRKKAADKAG